VRGVGLRWSNDSLRRGRLGEAVGDDDDDVGVADVLLVEEDAAVVLAGLPVSDGTRRRVISWETLRCSGACAWLLES